MQRLQCHGLRKMRTIMILYDDHDHDYHEEDEHDDDGTSAGSCKDYSGTG